MRPADEPLKMLTMRLVDKLLAGDPYDQIEATQPLPISPAPCPKARH